MNGDKTRLLIVCRPPLSQYKQDIYLLEEPKNVVPSNQISILGWYLNERISYDTTVNRNIAIVQNKMNKLKEFQECVSEDKLVIIAKSHLFTQLNYGLPLIIGQNECVINAYHRCYMRIVRWSKKSFCFQQSVSSICKSISVDSPRDAIHKNTAKFARNVIFNRRPKQILKHFRLPRTRNTAKIGKHFTINTKYAKKSILNHSVDAYNALPDQLKIQDTKEFNKMLKKLKLMFKPD